MNNAVVRYREKVNAAVTQAKTKKLLPEAISREAQGAQNAEDASEVTNGQDINAEVNTPVQPICSLALAFTH